MTASIEIYRNPRKGVLKGAICRRLHRNPRKGLLKAVIFRRFRRNPRKVLLKGQTFHHYRPFKQHLTRVLSARHPKAL